MKRAFTLIFCIVSLSLLESKSEEGMWLLPLLEEYNMDEMSPMGLKLTAEQIYSINTSSLKDAIVIFGKGCTGEMVSEEGLLFTNHHCGFDQIQEHSTLENDYLKDGFWAMSRDEELPNPGLEVKFLRRIEDVTEQIFQDLSDSLTLEDRQDTIAELIKEIEADASEDEKYECSVKSFYNGNEYYLLVYQVYKDVRLVGAPPSSIGKFGYDSDNWEWPRHTGDFSVFRVYTGPDGSPADYSEENIPLKPDHFLPVSLEGVNDGDFTFIMGYPGRTDRYLSSAGIKNIMEIVNTNRINIRGQRLDILGRAMKQDPKVRIQYASKYSSSSNYWKYSIGQNRGLRALKVLEKKKTEELEFQTWADADSTRKKTYGNVLEEIDRLYVAKRKAEMNINTISEIFFSATELINLTVDFTYLRKKLKTGSEEEIQEEISELKEEVERFYKDYNLPTDIKMTKAMIPLYLKSTNKSEHPEIFTKIEKKYKGDYDRYVDKIFKNSFFTDQKKVEAFLENPSVKALDRDMVFNLGQYIFMAYLKEYRVRSDYNLELEHQEYLYTEGRKLKDPYLYQYPDANFTMRLTYGEVGDYSPGDAVHYDEITFLKGVMEKEDTTNFEYLVPKKLQELYQLKDYGNYGDNTGMPVCFITDNDITGGNSGSPVLNGNGELIGLAFDGNWEAMSGDIAFEPELQRCICVDIRYVLFIIDKFAGASHLIEELNIIEKQN